MLSANKSQVTNMNTKTIETFCPECDQEVTANIIEQSSTVRIKGEDIHFTEHVAICPRCGAEIGDSRIEGPNIDAAYDVYRKRHGIVSPNYLKSLRKRYGLSTREFSLFLGFGEQTEHRYETGSIPDNSQNTIIKLASTGAGAAFLLSENGGKITQKSVERVKAFIDKKTSKHQKASKISLTK